MDGFITYTTKEGDCFDAIAFELYTDEKLASKIIELNPEYADVLIFEAGVEIKAPIIEEDEETPGTAPPWRQ